MYTAASPLDLLVRREEFVRQRQRPGRWSISGGKISAQSSKAFCRSMSICTDRIISTCKPRRSARDNCARCGLRLRHSNEKACGLQSACAPVEKEGSIMIRRRRARFSRSRAREQRAETSRKTTVLFRYTLLGLGMAVFAIALVSTAAFLSTGPEKASFLARNDAALSSGPEEAPFLARSNAAMTRMMAAMKIKPSNDVDRDFVAMMVPHHQGAIDMAEAELSYGHNKPLRRLAQEIIVTQQQEIAVMRHALGEPLPPPVPSPQQPPSSSRPLLPSHLT